MAVNRGSQVDQGVDLLQLTRPHDRQQPFDRALALFTARPKHDLAPLNRGSEGAFGGVIRRIDPILMYKGEEVLVEGVQRPREITHVALRSRGVLLAESKERAFDGQRLRDQGPARERGAAREGIAAKAVPQPKE